jgi:hypothetical protein
MQLWSGAGECATEYVFLAAKQRLAKPK